MKLLSTIAAFFLLGVAGGVAFPPHQPMRVATLTPFEMMPFEIDLRGPETITLLPLRLMPKPRLEDMLREAPPHVFPAIRPAPAKKYEKPAQVVTRASVLKHDAVFNAKWGT